MTIFIKLTDAPIDEKARMLRESVQTVASGRCMATRVFPVESTSLRSIPTSPFSYWVSAAIRSVFQKMSRFESQERNVKQGLATADDFRFVRAGWEVSEVRVGERWFAFAKGGSFSPFYAAISMCVNWESLGAEIKNNLNAQGGVRSNVWMLRDTADKYFFRPGLTWPLRGIRLSTQAVPSGCIFSVAGKMAFAHEASLLAYLALFNSKPFDFLVNTRAGKIGGVQYEVGLIQTTPVPDLTPTAKAIEPAAL